MTSEERMLMDIYLAKQKEQDESDLATVGKRVQFQDLQFENEGDLYSIDGTAVLYDSGHPSDIFIDALYYYDKHDNWVEDNSPGLIMYYSSFLLDHKDVCLELYRLSEL